MTRFHDEWKDVEPVGMTPSQRRKHNLMLSRRYIHNANGVNRDELRCAVNDLGDEVIRLEGVVKKLRSQLRKTKRPE